MEKKKAKRYNFKAANPWVNENPDVDESLIMNKKGKGLTTEPIKPAHSHKGGKKKKHKGKAVKESNDDDFPSANFGSSLAHSDFTSTAPSKNNHKKKVHNKKKNNASKNNELFPTLGALGSTPINLGHNKVARPDFDFN
jgi:hypothetical protein